MSQEFLLHQLGAIKTHFEPFKQSEQGNPIADFEVADEIAAVVGAVENRLRSMHPNFEQEIKEERDQLAAKRKLKALKKSSKRRIDDDD